MKSYQKVINLAGGHFFVYCGAKFDRICSCNAPVTPTQSLYTRGFHAIKTPYRAIFLFQDPSSETPQLPALRAEMVGRTATRRQPFILLFFSFSVPPPKAAQICRQRPVWGSFPRSAPKPHTAAHRGKHGQSYALPIICGDEVKAQFFSLNFDPLLCGG